MAGRPNVTITLIAVNVAIFVFMVFQGAGVMTPAPLTHIEWGSNFGPLTTSGQWWRLGTAAFLHFGLLHLLFNMWALWVVGGLVERVFGPGRFLLIYGVAALCGSLASVSWNPLVNSAGASGAVFGVLGAQLAFFLRAGHGIPPHVLRAQRASTLAFIGYSVVFGFIAPGIDNAAHFGGLMAGFALGWLMAMPVESGERRQALAGTALAVALAAVLLGAGFTAATRSAQSRAAEQSYLRGWPGQAEREDALVNLTNEVLAGARSGELSDAEVARRLEQEVAPAWDRRRERLAATRLPTDSPLYAGQARSIAIAAARADGFSLMAEALRENDRDKMERAVALLDSAQQRASGQQAD